MGRARLSFMDCYLAWAYDEARFDSEADRSCLSLAVEAPYCLQASPSIAERERQKKPT